MEPLVKGILEKQMQILSALSEHAVGSELAIYTEQIVKLANLLKPVDEHRKTTKGGEFHG